MRTAMAMPYLTWDGSVHLLAYPARADGSTDRDCCEQRTMHQRRAATEERSSIAHHQLHTPLIWSERGIDDYLEPLLVGIDIVVDIR